jgi:hypothetical protein
MRQIESARMLVGESEALQRIVGTHAAQPR